MFLASRSGGVFGLSEATGELLVVAPRVGVMSFPSRPTGVLASVLGVSIGDELLCPSGGSGVFLKLRSKAGTASLPTTLIGIVLVSMAEGLLLPSRGTVEFLVSVVEDVLLPSN